ncbi:unnamed protein product [Urochloa humidicola]
MDSVLESQIALDSILESQVVTDSVQNSVAMVSDDEIASDSVSSQSMVAAPDSVATNVLDSSQVNVVVAPDSESMEFVQDSEPFVVVPERWPCSRCGLIHEDYNLSARIIYDLNEFDCKLFIPDLDKVEMDGNTLIAPPNVLEMIDKMN